MNGELGILDWYTVVVGVAAFATLMLHGALWVAFRTDGELAGRCRVLAARVWWAVAALAVVITALSFLVQPQLWVSFSARPWGFVFPVAGVVALVLVRVWIARGTSSAFLASCGFIAAMLVSAAFGLYPYVLVARGDARFGLTISNAAAAGMGCARGCGGLFRGWCWRWGILFLLIGELAHGWTRIDRIKITQQLAHVGPGHKHTRPDHRTCLSLLDLVLEGSVPQESTI